MSVVVVGLADKSGFVIRHEESDKLESVWILTADEAQEQADQINFQAKLAEHLPNAHDPEVQALVNDPDFSPVEYEDVEVPDYERSNIVYVTKPGRKIIADGEVAFAPDEIKYDDTGQPVINWQASDVVTKIEKQPKRVSGLGRIGAAVEQVAHKRLKEATGCDYEGPFHDYNCTRCSERTDG